MHLDALKRSLRGSVIAAWDPDYETARDGLVFNGLKPARRPRLIVRARSAQDVQAAVRFAAAEGLAVSPRGGGHNWSGIAQQAGMIDVSRLDHLRVDPAARRADVGPGVGNRALARALARHGLAFPTGHCESVPVSGYLLGGGFGWNSGEWGMACFSVESLDVVLADGLCRRVTATSDPDIFWAARGAGPEFFGIVVGYRLRLQELPRAITTTVLTYPLAEVGPVVDWAQAARARAPRNVELTLVMRAAPPPVAERCGHVVAAAATVFAADAAEAAATLAALTADAPAGALDAMGPAPTPLDALYDITSLSYPAGRRFAVDSFWAGAGAGELVRGLAEAVAAAPSPEAFALATVLPEPVAMPEAAFSMVGPVLGCAYAVWQDAGADAAQLGWLRGSADAVAPAAVGHYVGEADLDRPGRLAAAFSPEAWARLKALQARYDPRGMFRHAETDAEARSAA